MISNPIDNIIQSCYYRYVIIISKKGVNKIRKLILLDEEENILEIKEPKYFEEKLPVEDLKLLYQDTYNYLEVNNILEGLCEAGLIEKHCEDENADREVIEDLKYTLEYLGRILQQRVGLEFELFKEYCKEQFYKNS